MNTSLQLYYKQGDDFADALARAKHNVSKAFEIWANDLRAQAEVCDKLATRFKGVNVQISTADGIFIMLDGEDKEANAVLAKLIKEEVLEEGFPDDEDAGENNE